MDINESLPFLILNSRPQRLLRKNRRGLALEKSRKHKLVSTKSNSYNKTDIKSNSKDLRCSGNAIGLSEMDKLQARSRAANAKELLQRDNTKVNLLNGKSKQTDVIMKSTGVPNKRIKLSPPSPIKPVNKSPPVCNGNESSVPSPTRLTPIGRKIKLNRASIGL